MTLAKELCIWLKQVGFHEVIDQTFDIRLQKLVFPTNIANYQSSQTIEKDFKHSLDNLQEKISAGYVIFLMASQDMANFLCGKPLKNG